MKVYERGLGPTSIRQSKDVRVDITQLLEPCDELDRRARRSLFFKAETARLYKRSPSVTADATMGIRCRTSTVIGMILRFPQRSTLNWLELVYSSLPWLSSNMKRPINLEEPIGKAVGRREAADPLDPAGFTPKDAIAWDAALPAPSIALPGVTKFA